MGFTLAIGTQPPASFDVLGIVAAKLEETIEAKSTLTIETAAHISSAPIIMPFQRAMLFDADGALRFVGWLDEAPRSAQGDAHRVTYKLSGPHRWLSRTPYVQSSGGVVKLGGSDEPQAWNVAYDEIRTVALAKYSGAFTVGGQTPFTHDIPTRTRADVDCLTAILSLVSYAPTAVFWWTYLPGGLPCLNIGDGSGSVDKTLSTATHALSAADLNPRYDLLADVVTVYMTDSSGSITSWGSSGPTGDAATLMANRTVIYTYNTSQLNNLPQSGLQTALGKWHQTLHIDGSATRQGIDWTDRPGNIYGFAGADLTRFSGFKSILHSIVRDLMTEETKLELGVIAGKDLYRVSDLDDGSANTALTVSSLAGQIAAAQSAASQAQSAASQAANAASDAQDAAEAAQSAASVEDRVKAIEDALTGGNTSETLNTEDDVIKRLNDLEKALFDGEATSDARDWREVERCDGKKMQVWGTDWA